MIDEVRRDRIRGRVTRWPQKSDNVKGEGRHTFRWPSVKEGSPSEGDDRGYIDYLQWTGDVAPESSEWAEIKYTHDPQSAIGGGSSPRV